MASGQVSADEDLTFCPEYDRQEPKLLGRHPNALNNGDPHRMSIIGIGQGGWENVPVSLSEPLPVQAQDLATEQEEGGKRRKSSSECGENHTEGSDWKTVQSKSRERKLRRKAKKEKRPKRTLRLRGGAGNGSPEGGKSSSKELEKTEASGGAPETPVPLEKAAPFNPVLQAFKKREKRHRSVGRQSEVLKEVRVTMERLLDAKEQTPRREAEEGPRTSYRERLHSIHSDNPFKRKANSPLSDPMELRQQVVREDKNLTRELFLLEDCIKEMSVFIKANKNVHVSIKNMAHKMEGHVKEMRRTYDALAVADLQEREERCSPNLASELLGVNKLKEDRIQKLEKKVVSLKKRSQEDAKTKDDKIQELEKKVALLSKQLKEKKAWGQSRVTEDEIKKWCATKDADTIVDLVQKQWEENLFRKTEVRVGNPLDTKEGGDTAFVWTKNEQEQGRANVLQKLFVDKYGDFGEVGFNHQHIASTVYSRGEKKVTDRSVYSLKLEKDSEEEVVALLRELRSAMVTSGRRTVTIPKITGMTPEKTRKLVELAWWEDSDLNAIVFTPPQPPKKAQSQAAPEERKVRPRTTEVVTVETTGLSYKDALKVVKEKVLTTLEPGKIRGLRQSANGKLLIITEGDEKQTRTKLCDRLKEVMPERKVFRSDVKSAKTSLRVVGLDALATTEEITEEVEKLVGSGAEIVSKRESYGQTQEAVLKLSPEKAKKLATQGFISVGHVRCKVREVVDPKMCFKCMGYDHLARNCKLADKSKHCRRCGEEGHIAKTCSKDRFCLTCDEKGHSTGSFKCSERKKALEKLRAKTPNLRPKKDKGPASK